MDNKNEIVNTPFGPISVADEDFFGGSMDPEMAEVDSPEDNSRERKDMASVKKKLKLVKAPASDENMSDESKCRQIIYLTKEYERRARMCAAYNGMSKQRWYERIMERAIEEEYKKIRERYTSLH